MSTLNLNPFEYQLRNIVFQMERQLASPVIDGAEVKKCEQSLALTEEAMAASKSGASAAHAQAASVKALLSTAKELVKEARQRIGPDT